MRGPFAADYRLVVVISTPRPETFPLQIPRAVV